MSAIAGIWSFDGGVPVSSACRAMLQALSVYMARMTRAQYTSPSVAMGRCLLRLLPEDAFDRQPLSAGDVTALVADVRLDNRAELGLELGHLRSTVCGHGGQRYAVGGVAALARTVCRPSFRRLQLRGLGPAGTASLPGSRSHRGTSSLLCRYGELLRLRFHAQGFASACPLWARRWMKITSPAI